MHAVLIILQLFLVGSWAQFRFLYRQSFPRPYDAFYPYYFQRALPPGPFGPYNPQGSLLMNPLMQQGLPFPPPPVYPVLGSCFKIGVNFGINSVLRASEILMNLGQSAPTANSQVDVFIRGQHVVDVVSTAFAENPALTTQQLMGVLGVSPWDLTLEIRSQIMRDSPIGCLENETFKKGSIIGTAIGMRARDVAKATSYSNVYMNGKQIGSAIGIARRALEMYRRALIAPVYNYVDE